MPCSILPPDFSAENCDSELLADMAIESIARGLCSLGCRGENIKCSGSKYPFDWENLFTNDGNCGEAPCGSMIFKLDNDGTLMDVMIKTELKSPPTAFAGTWVSMYDPVGFDGEFRVASGLPDPNNPSLAQLRALFGDNPWNYALVYIPEAGAFWYTRSKGKNFTRVENTLSASVYSDYTKRTVTVPISPLTTRIIVPANKQYKAGTRIRCIFEFGYNILTFGNGTGPVDNVEMRAILRAGGGTARTAHQWTNLRNGFSTTSVLVITLPYDGTPSLHIRSAHTGSYVGWSWRVFLRYAHFQAIGV